MKMETVDKWNIQQTNNNIIELWQKQHCVSRMHIVKSINPTPHLNLTYKSKQIVYKLDFSVNCKSTTGTLNLPFLPWGSRLVTDFYFSTLNPCISLCYLFVLRPTEIHKINTNFHGLSTKFPLWEEEKCGYT